jgi:hypothetical protein
MGIRLFDNQLSRQEGLFCVLFELSSPPPWPTAFWTVRREADPFPNPTKYDRIIEVIYPGWPAFEEFVDIQSLLILRAGVCVCAVFVSRHSGVRFSSTRIATFLDV